MRHRMRGCHDWESASARYRADGQLPTAGPGYLEELARMAAVARQPSRCLPEGTCTPIRGVIMSGDSQSGNRAQQMRDKAQELEQTAQHATDPAERQRLKDKAMRIREKAEKEYGRGSGTMDPM
ncbi:DUF6381 family protein [Streptomyces sp. NPDC048357]|uniref:DUF6381 family protein n=1 Tax=Streptomyces sp. NPDC048357 TaxID=3154719 RepID=UPI00343D2C6F